MELLENKTLVSDLFYEVFENSRLKVLVNSLVNTGIEMMTEAIGVPENLDAVYESFIETLSAAKSSEDAASLREAYGAIFKKYGIEITDKYCEVCSSNQSEPKKTTAPYRTTTSLPHVEQTIKAGSVFDAKTHAELLNIVLGKNYRGYMQSSIKLPDGKLLWMIELGKFISSAGWINQLFSNNLIKETHVGTKFEFGHNTYKNAISTGKFFDDSDRVVFDVIKNGSNRKYVFRGVFRLNKIDSSTNENIWNLILDEYRI